MISASFDTLPSLLAILNSSPETVIATHVHVEYGAGDDGVLMHGTVNGNRIVKIVLGAEMPLQRATLWAVTSYIATLAQERAEWKHKTDVRAACAAVSDLLGDRTPIADWLRTETCLEVCQSSCDSLVFQKTSMN